MTHKRSGVALLVLLLMGTGVLSAATEDTTAVPVLDIAVTDHQFDAVVEGTEVVYDFTVRNKGTADLLIHKVRTG